MTSAARLAYGARPVSMDLTRGRVLSETAALTTAHHPTRPAGASAADRLALAHWPAGHRVVVCGLDGGTGRTTVASLVAATLAELPYAHTRKPVALAEMQPRVLSTTRRRWLSEQRVPEAGRRATDQYRPSTTGSGIALPLRMPSEPSRAAYSVLVVEAPAGIPAEYSVVSADPSASVLLVVRPDRRSLAEAAEALVWMHDRGLVQRGRVVVMVNLGIGQADRRTRALSTALAVRCRAVHRLPHDVRLGPTACLPSAGALAPTLRPLMTKVCLDVWRTSQLADRRSLQEEVAR